MDNVSKFHIGDRVKKATGDYTVYGEVRAAFFTKKKLIRYVVEIENLGMLMIYNGEQLVIANKEEP